MLPSIVSGLSGSGCFWNAVNGRFGAGTLFYAGAGIKQAWAMKRGLKSPHYTTEWESLLRVGA
jgi:Domain of unknown function (DUF4113)